MVTFKKASAGIDFEIIAGLADTIWKQHYIPIVGKPQIDYMLDKYQSADAIAAQVHGGFAYYLLQFENEFVGYISIKPEQTLLFLSKIYVLSVHRGKGIGKQAMTFVEDQARSQQLKGIRLTVNVNNVISIAAYEKLGFQNNGPLVTDIGNGFIMDDYEMLKFI